MAAEAEPRRSVRATKGQHKALEQLDQAAEAPKRRGRKKKATQEEKQEEPEEEVIRCVCGATEQDGDDSGEPWIACDKCGAWQHNVCMGMSVYSEDLPGEYYCEQCRPEDHQELLAGTANGEKLWEARRKAYEQDEADKRKKRGPKGRRGKRHSDPKDETPQTPPAGNMSPAPESVRDTKATAGTKRKTREDEEAKWQGSQKLRRTSEPRNLAVPYNPPADLPAKVTELLDARQGPAKLLQKTLVYAVGSANKKGLFDPTDGVSPEVRAERWAIEIERAVHDTHPDSKEYKLQIRTLSHNLKNNLELVVRLLVRSLSPPMLATMSSDELASQEMQREMAEMQARADKQSILITEDGPRMRRTHKGEELVGDDSFAAQGDETSSTVRRVIPRQQSPAKSSHPRGGSATNDLSSPLRVNTDRHSPKPDFDINKVFSSVKSPIADTNRRSSQAFGPTSGPGVDPEVDRLLQDDREESPPYSPTEETDPDVIWRGTLAMNNVANLHATAKHIGGANLNTTIGLPWSQLIPKRLNVAGRIDPQKAIEYLCSLRYSAPTDVIVVNITPTVEEGRHDFNALYEYFTSKERYGVVGEKGIAGVRDTYLIPVAPGSGNHPEFMMNLVDNFIPEARTDPFLLLVFVYRNEGLPPQNHTNTAQSSSTFAAISSPTPASTGFQHQRHPSISAPQFSPTSPQDAFPSYASPHNNQAPMSSASWNSTAGDHDTREVAQREGEALAREILGALIHSPTVKFILPQAFQMNRREWEVIRRVYERDPRSRDDLTHLSRLLDQEGSDGKPADNAQPGPGIKPPQPSQPPHPQRTQIPPPVIPPPMTKRQTPIPPPPIPPQAQSS